MRPPARSLVGWLAVGGALALTACASSSSPGVDAVGPVEAAGIATTTPADTDDASPGDDATAPAGERDGAEGGDDVAAGTVDAVAEPPELVAVVGDSLTVSAQEEIDAALTDLGVGEVVVDGLENRRMTIGGSQPGLDAIVDLVAAGLEPDVWVIALGTNDVGAQVRDDDYRRAVVDVLSAIPSGALVVWVDVWVRNLADRSASANEVLRGVAHYRPWVTVVDWYSHGEDEGIVIKDGVHLTNDGQQLFADEIAEAVESVADASGT